MFVDCCSKGVKDCSTVSKGVSTVSKGFSMVSKGFSNDGFQGASRAVRRLFKGFNDV